MHNSLSRAVYLTLLLLFLFHFGQVLLFSLDIPLWDQWDLLKQDALPGNSWLSWAVERHNEHRILPTKVQTIILYLLNGWNIRSELAINFLTFGLVLVAILRFAEARFGREALSETAFCLLFFLSPLNWQNHAWGFQSSFHYVLLFFLAGAHLLFAENPGWKTTLSGALSWALSVFSLGTGVALCAAAFPFYAAHVWLSLPADPVARRERLAGLAVVTAVLGLAIALWSHAIPGQNHPALFSSLLEPRFWHFFLNLVGFGFGMTAESWFTGVLCLLLVLFPLAGIFLKGLRIKLDGRDWSVLAVNFGALSALLLIALGRFRLGTVGPKEARYFEAAVLLVPFTAMAARLAPWPGGRARKALIPLFALLLFGAFAPHWNFGIYKEMYFVKLRGIACLGQALESGKRPVSCPDLYHSDLAPLLENAQRLRLSFLRGQ